MVLSTKWILLWFDFYVSPEECLTWVEKIGVQIANSEYIPQVSELLVHSRLSNYIVVDVDRKSINEVRLIKTILLEYTLLILLN